MKSDFERAELNKKKNRCVEIKGIKVINPLTNEEKYQFGLLIMY